MTDQQRPKPYAVEVTVAVSRDRAWQAVTQPQVLRQWFGWDYDGLDDEIRHIFVAEATVLASHRMGWADGSYLEVTGDTRGSVVRVARDGPPPADPDAYDAIEEGWRAFLTQLRFWLSERPSGERRTVYLTGATTGRQVLSLTGGDWRRYGLRVASTVDADGSLVVVASRAHLDSPHPSRVEVTVSTYGLDRAGFEACHAGWAGRWGVIAAEPSVTVAGQPAPH